MFIQLKQAYSGKQPGERVGVDEKHARSLIDQGVAEAVQEACAQWAALCCCQAKRGPGLGHYTAGGVTTVPINPPCRGAAGSCSPSAAPTTSTSREASVSSPFQTNTTCDIYRNGPPAAPDVAGVAVVLQPDFGRALGLTLAPSASSSATAARTWP